MARNIAKEKNHVTPGKTEAKSSIQALFFHDIPPELLRRIAKRYTDGHKKYGVKHTNLNWRIGINDEEYVADRFNHLFTHLINFLEDGNDKDDNLAAIAWSVGFLMEVERHAPKILKSVIGHCKYFGNAAKTFRNSLKEK